MSPPVDWSEHFVAALAAMTKAEHLLNTDLRAEGLECLREAAKQIEVAYDLVEIPQRALPF